jgi:hypothetical protein
MSFKNWYCAPCRFWGRDAPWAFLFVAAGISLSSLGPIFQRGAAYLVVIALVLLAASFALAKMTPSRRKF